MPEASPLSGPEGEGPGQPPMEQTRRSWLSAKRPPAAAEDPRIDWFDGTDLTHQAESPRSLNYFMLGVLSARLAITEDVWHAALDSVKAKPALREVNREMFAAGRRAALPRPASRRRANGRTRP